jgi:hypothetical protein
MERDFANPSARWQAAVIDNPPIVYTKLSPLRAPDPQLGAMELQQI